MDGVLADFDRHHETVVGYRSDKLLDNANWDAVETYKTTYLARSDAHISPGGPTCDDDCGAASIKCTTPQLRARGRTQPGRMPP
jgi:hypothetical protein